MKPMLAHKFNDKRAKFPCYGQFKYNGIRALWLNNHLQSRSYGKDEPSIWDPDRLVHIQTALKLLMFKLNTKSLLLDGELYCHGMSLQQINARARVTSTKPHDKEDELVYVIFDVISSEPFLRRANWLEMLKEKVTPSLQIAPTYYLSSRRDAERLHRLAMDNAYEGSMLRDPDAGYGLIQNCGNQENRWKTLLKRKDWLDMDCVITGVIEGRQGKTGKLLGKAGALELKTPDGKIFRSGGGLYINQRERIWNLRESLIGKKVRIIYDELSDDGKPLRNRVEMIDDPRVQ